MLVSQSPAQRQGNKTGRLPVLPAREAQMKLQAFGELRRGRPVEINRKELEYGHNYAEVVFCGDWHLGHPNCLVERITELLDYALRNKVYVLLMGDLIEAGLTGSVGDSVYTQKLNPQQQVDRVIEILHPLVRKKLVLGLLEGNHEARILKATGINVAKMMAGTLGVPYLHEACWNVWRVGSQKYTIYALHGASGSKFIYTKLKAATDIAHYFPQADIVAHAHVHDIASVAIERQYVGNGVNYRKQYVLLTGHYLGYRLSYAEAKGMPPSKVGSPKVKLVASEHDIHIRV